MLAALPLITRQDTLHCPHCSVIEWVCKDPSLVRRSAALVFAIALMFAGSQVAHALAYRLAYPELHVRVRMLALSGHGYMGYMPLVLGLVSAVIAVLLAWTVVDAARGGEPRPVPAGLFAALPVLGFTFQEFIERYLHGAGFAWWMVLQPTFRIGVLLQLPFGLAAYLVARFLLRIAERLGGALAARAHPPRRRVVSVRRQRPVEEPPRRLGALTVPGAGRAPPTLLSAL